MYKSTTLSYEMMNFPGGHLQTTQNCSFSGEYGYQTTHIPDRSSCVSRFYLSMICVTIWLLTTFVYDLNMKPYNETLVDR